MKNRILSLITLSCIVSLGGCKSLAALVVVTEQTRTVPAEYDKLAGHSALAYVWVEPETRFDFPYLQLELTSYVTEEMRTNLKNVNLTPPQTIISYIEQNLDMELNPKDVGNHFGVDRVVFIEIKQFQLHDLSTPDLVQTRIRSSVSIIDLAENPDHPEVENLDPVMVVHPDGAPHMSSRVNIDQVRREAYLEFADAVTRKFYESKEVLN